MSPCSRKLWTFSANHRATTPGHGVALSQVIEECLNAKEQANRRKEYIISLRTTFTQFQAGRRDMLCHEVKPGVIEQWLHGTDWKPVTKEGYLKNLRTLFSFAVRRGYCLRNPATQVEPIGFSDDPPKVTPVEEWEKVLRTMQALDTPLIRLTAICLFGGVRPQREAATMNEDAIVGDYVEISTDRAKTRARRLVWINPTMWAWLDLGGTLPLTNVRRRMATIKHESGVKWPRNSMRRSFISYALPVFGLEKVVEWAGHDQAMTFSNYRDLRTVKGVSMALR